MPQDQDQIKVLAPDNSVHRFPKGTDMAVIDRTMKEYITKGKALPQAKPPAQQPTPQPIQQKPPEQKTEPNPFEVASQFWQSQRPRWDKPEEILKDPSWVGRSGRYAGGEFIGAGKAGLGMGVGGTKLLYDLWNLGVGGDKPLEAGKEVGKDIKGIGQGFTDLGKDVWDLIRHFPEASADPEKFGQTILNSALTVDGGVKLAGKLTQGLINQRLAEGLAPSAGLNPTEALTTATRAMAKAPSRFFQRKAFEDAYVHAKGLDVAKKVSAAAKEVDKEVQTHAQGIASQIDTAIPSGVVNATDEALTIFNEFKDAVKTPETAHPLLRQMVDDAQKTAPGSWTWEKVRQFRSSIGRAMGKVQGPQRVVLTKIYKDLTNKLGSTARQYGLGESWDHYNELERKMSHEFADVVDTLRNAQSGQEVARALGKDKALTSELSNNLAKYGLDKQEVLKFVKDADRIAKQQKGWKGTLFRMAYGSPAGVPAMMAVRAAGGGWLPSVAVGAGVGYASSGLINMARALRLSPEVIEQILSQRELPGRKPLSQMAFPREIVASGREQQGGPSGGGDSGPSGLSPLEGSALRGFLKRHPEDLARLSKQIAQGGSGVEAAKQEMRKLLQGERKTDVGPPTGTQERRVAQPTATKQLPAPKVEPKVTKVAPGEVGREAGARPGTTRESKIGRNTKQAERVAKKRAEAMRTKQSEEAEAQARAMAQDVNVSHFQIPEMEEALREKNPHMLKGLQGLRRRGKVTDEEYRAGLQELILRAYEEAQ